MCAHGRGTSRSLQVNPVEPGDETAPTAGSWVAKLDATLDRGAGHIEDGYLITKTFIVAPKDVYVLVGSPVVPWPAHVLF